MCGRYTNDAEFSEIRVVFDAQPFERLGAWKPTYNITPAYGPGFEQLIVVPANSAVRQIRAARWWMIPWFWSKPLKSLPSAFNARIEDVASKPFWREAFQSRRCLVPTTGWREFKGERGKKQPYHFRMQGLFAFAGLWSTWTSPDGEVVDSFAIVTTRPNQAAEPYHDRMPLIMPPDSYAAWLDAGLDPKAALEAAETAKSALELEIYPSDPIGNNGRFEGPEAIAPVEPKAPPDTPAQQELFGAGRTGGER
jgi:putative SOS response-associated peptidase YedK